MPVYLSLSSTTRSGNNINPSRISVFFSLSAIDYIFDGNVITKMFMREQMQCIVRYNRQRHRAHNL